jgi:hypothetical protein
MSASSFVAEAKSPCRSVTISASSLVAEATSASSLVAEAKSARSFVVTCTSVSVATSTSSIVAEAKSLSNTATKAIGSTATACNLTAEILHNPWQAAKAINSVFGGISAHDVRQRAGRTYGNAGEVLPSGVTRILEAVGPLGEDDVFLDVGAGVGNIVAQVALATNAKRCIGVELRKDLVALGQCCIQQHIKHQPLLGEVLLKQADVRDVSLSSHSLICEATVVFANIFLFEEDAKLVVSRELSAMPMARVIVSTSQFCPRHRSTCSEPYCKRWCLERQIEVHCSWKSACHPVYIYCKTR